MTSLFDTVRRILAELPENQLTSEEELGRAVRRGGYADASPEDISAALLELDRDTSLVAAFMETSEMLTFGVGLKSSMTAFPNRALVAVGL